MLHAGQAVAREGRVSPEPMHARLRIVCRGVVQGVGFRPAVHRLASSLALGGFVRNGPEGVVIEVEGAEAGVRAFVDRLPRSLPPLARIDEMETAEVAASGQAGFAVLASEEGKRARALVPPDTALCSDCRAEMEDPGDRRHHYAFTTCTNCGPRFTLVGSLPYDRERTSMACFPLCQACRREYEDPADRRFHAEPVCCPECGPRLWLEIPWTVDRGPLSEETRQGTGHGAQGTESKTWTVDRGPLSEETRQGTGQRAQGTGDRADT